MKARNPIARFTAALLSLALVQLSFGPEAWAQMIPRVGAVPAPVGGAAAAAAGAAGPLGAGNSAALSMSAASLATSPLAPSAFLSAPSAAPAFPAVAISPAAAAETPPSPASDPDAAAAAPSPVASNPAAAATLEDRAPAAGPGARVAQRFAELKSFFGGKKEPALPSEGAAAGRVQTPPASEPSDGASAKSREPMMKAYIGATNATQAGYEMLSSASLPVYLEKTFGNMSWMADMSIAGTFANMIGRQLSPLIIKRFKLKTAYIGLLVAASLPAFALGRIANFGTMTIPKLFVLMISFNMVRAASSTAERTVIPSVYGSDQRAIESLRGRKQSWAEVASVLVQNGAAALVIILGSAAPNLLIAPWFYLAAIGVLAFTLKIPPAADAARQAGQNESVGRGAGAFASLAAIFKNFGRQIMLGFKVVTRDPVLRTSAMLTNFITLFNIITYSLLVPLFAKFSVGAGADSKLAAPIMGLIAGLFSFGGLYAGKLVAKQAADLAAKHGNDAAAVKEASRRSTIKWIKRAALSFLLVGAMALPLPILAPLISPVAVAAAVAGLLHVSAAAVPTSLLLAGVLGLGTVLAMWRPKLGLAIAAAPVLLAFPSHVILAAIAFFTFGLLQVVASLKNDSFFDAAVQTKAPADYSNAAAFVGASSMFAGMLGLTGLKYLFYGKLPFGIPSPFPAFLGLHGLWPFVVVFGALAVPAAFVFHRAARRLDKLTAPDGSAKPKN